MTAPINTNPNAYYALQGYKPSNNPFNRDNINTTPRVPGKEGVDGAKPYAPSPAHTGEAYEGQAVVSQIAHDKAGWAKVGLGGNPHATETLGNRLNATEYDLL